VAAHRCQAAGGSVDPVQTATFLGAIREHPLYAAYHLIALRGLRRGEACGLRWCDIDLDHRVAHINWHLLANPEARYTELGLGVPARPTPTAGHAAS